MYKGCLQRAKKEFYSLYYPNYKIQLSQNDYNNDLPVEMRKTDDMSVNFTHMKIYRNEIDEINKLKSRIGNPANDFLNLLSYAICQDVDTYNACKRLEKAHCYISLNVLFKIFHTHSVEEVNNKLITLKYGYHALDFEVVTNRQGYNRYYIYFTCCNDQIIEGSYKEGNPNYYDIKGVTCGVWQREGFYFVNKYWFIETFYNNVAEVQHGIKDLYFLLRTNLSYNDCQMFGNKIKNSNLVTWGLISNNMFNGLLPYITVQRLSEILKNSYKNVIRYINRLVELNFIEKQYLNNRGMVFTINSLNKYKKCDTIDFKEVFAEVKEYSCAIPKKLVELAMRSARVHLNQSIEKVKSVIISAHAHTPNLEFLNMSTAYKTIYNT